MEDRAIDEETCRIGLDAGTGVVRAVAHRDRDGRVVAHAEVPFAVDGAGGRREVVFEDVGRAQDVALEAVLARLPVACSVSTIGIAATASTVAVVDPRDGSATGRALFWSDHRAAQEAAAMRDAGHPNLARMLGHVSPEWGIAKLAHLARRGDLDAEELVLVELADWLGHRLTGAWVANAGTREWGWAGGDDGDVPGALLASAGAPAGSGSRVLRGVERTGSVLGAVTASAVRTLSPRLRGATVLVGGMDSYLAAVGMGVARPGRLCLTVGSSSAAIGGLACGDATGRMFGPLRTVLPGESGAWHGGQTTAGLAAAWAAGVLGRSRAALEREASASPPGARGVTFRETLLDRRTPRPRAPMTGAWSGLRVDHGPGDLYRAVLEGIAFGLAAASGDLSPREVVAGGGMLRSGLFRQILADVLGRPVARLADTGSAAARGAAFADDPGRVAGFVRSVSVTDPGDADYAEARERYLATQATDAGDAARGAP